MRTVEPEAGPLGTKKTILVIATVVGCIGILWPKIFHPMLIGGGSSSTETPLPPLKERGPGELTCQLQHVFIVDVSFVFQRHYDFFIRHRLLWCSSYF